MTHRPQLKDQPPKRIVKKTQDIRDVSLGDTFAIADIAMAFSRLKAGFLEKLNEFIQRGDDLVDDVKDRTDVELDNVKSKFASETETLSNETQATRERVETEVDEEIKKIGNILTEKTDNLITIFLKDFKERVTEEFTQKKNEIQQAINHALAIKKGEQGETPVVGVDFKQPEDGKDAVLTLKKFKELLKQLPEGFFHIKDIKDLQRQLENLAHKAGAAIALGGGQGSWKQVVLTGAIDGSNTVFTYLGDPFAEFSETVYLNYTPQNPLTDYTIVGNTVTYTVAPDASLSGFPHIIRGM